MIAHLVLFKFKVGIVFDEERVRLAVAGLRRLPERIPTICTWEQGFNMTPDARAWDYGLRATFLCEADLNAYFEHEAHVLILRQWEEISELIFCDFQLA